MPQTLLDLVQTGDFDAFESRCLELLTTAELPLAHLPTCFQALEAAGQAARIPALAQMVLENADLQSDARTALVIACAALNADPARADLRQTTIELYRRVHGDTPGFSAILDSSGLSGGAAPRVALRVLDLCLSLRVGDALVSRTDDRVVEVVEIDHERGLFTLRRGDRMTTVPAREVAREYERVAPDDFRVLRQLHPQRVAELLRTDPVTVVIGLIHAHGGRLDADQLKDELVPKHLDAQEWSKWWSGVRTRLKRSPHVIVEGRAPVVLRYTAEGVTLESETWAAFAAADGPVTWLNVIETYLRETKARRATADQELLRRCGEHIVGHVGRTRGRRPAEALAAALVLDRLSELELPLPLAPRSLVAEILQAAPDPAQLILGLGDDPLWERALAALADALPDRWPDCVTALLPVAPASQLDLLSDAARRGGRLDAVQSCIDDALADPVDFPEVVYWLWKGPQEAAGLRLPTDGVLFNAVFGALSALASLGSPPPDYARLFRARMKAAIGLREYARVREYLQICDPAAAVTYRRQFERLEGLGTNARTKLLDLLRAAHPQLWVRREEKLAPWADPEVIWVTQAGLDRKVAERDHVVNVKMKENAVRIGEAASHGDLSENSEYKFALEERDFLRARLARINSELSLARVLTPHDVPTDSVGIGSRVALRRVSDGAVRELTILGPFETDVEKEIYNYQAPICQKLMGLRVGQRTWLTLDGVEHEFEVTALANGLPVAATGGS